MTENQSVALIYNEIATLLQTKVQITGSFVLRYLGLYPATRELGDLDFLVYPTSDNVDKLHDTIYDKLYFDSEVHDDETYDNEDSDEMYKFKYKGWVVNLFVYKADVEPEESMCIDGFEMCTIGHTLNAKASYNRPKDKEDFLLIAETIDSYTRTIMYSEIVGSILQKAESTPVINYVPKIEDIF